MLEVITLTITPFYQNARIVADTDSGVAAIVDPGGDVSKFLDILRQKRWRCEQIWLTHSHLDHCGGVAKLIAATGAKLFAHEADRYLRESVVQEASYFGLDSAACENCPEPDHYVDEGDTLHIGPFLFQVLHTPGHSPGHVAFLCSDERVVVSGDSLFNGAIGRFDLAGGDSETLLTSIQTKLLTLPPETRVLCGHGGDTTVGAQLRENPYFNATAQRIGVASREVAS